MCGKRYGRRRGTKRLVMCRRHRELNHDQIDCLDYGSELTRIGRAAVIAFAQEGWRIVISGRNNEAEKALEDELRGLGAEAGFIRADVRFEDDVRTLVDETRARFGRLDAAVNNAGADTGYVLAVDRGEVGGLMRMASRRFGRFRSIIGWACSFGRLPKSHDIRYEYGRNRSAYRRSRPLEHARLPAQRPRIDSNRTRSRRRRVPLHGERTFGEAY